MNGLPAEKFEEWWRQSGDIDRAVDTFTLRRILKEAEAEVRKVRESDVAGRLYHLLSRIHFRLGNFTSALDNARKADPLLSTDGSVGAKIMVGVAAVAVDNLEDAFTALELVVRALPNDPQGWLNLAEVHFRQGDLKRAHQAYAHGESLAKDRSSSEGAVAAMLAVQAAELGLVNKVRNYAEIHRGIVGDGAFEQVLKERHMAKVRRILRLNLKPLAVRKVDPAIYVNPEAHAVEQLKVLEEFSDLRDSALEEAESLNGQASSLP